MTNSSLKGPLALSAVLAGLLIAAGCGSDSDGDASSSTGGTTAESTGAATSSVDGDATGDIGSAIAITACEPGEIPSESTYEVKDITGDLRVRSAPGTDADLAFTLTSGNTVGVFPGDRNACAKVDDGSIWWQLSLEESEGGWVASRFLQPQGAASDDTAEICRLYDEVLGFEVAPNFAPRSLTGRLNTALDQPPPGVSDALERISSPANDEDLFLAYESLKGYVGPICAQP